MEILGLYNGTGKLGAPSPLSALVLTAGARSHVGSRGVFEHHPSCYTVLTPWKSVGILMLIPEKADLAVFV